MSKPELSLRREDQFNHVVDSCQSCLPGRLQQAERGDSSEACPDAYRVGDVFQVSRFIEVAATQE